MLYSDQLWMLYPDTGYIRSQQVISWANDVSHTEAIRETLEEYRKVNGPTSYLPDDYEVPFEPITDLGEAVDILQDAGVATFRK